MTDNAGATDNVVIDVEVLDPGPIVDYVFNPVPGVTGEPVTFTSTSTDADGGTLASFAWDFGDGSPPATGPVVDHSFAGYGAYSVLLTVTDDDGNERTRRQLVTVDAPPLPDFDVALASAAGGAEATFTDESTDADGTIVAWSWDFGDGATSTDQRPVHQYVDPGTFTVSLTVTDDVGTSRTATGEITIVGTPTADFALDPITPSAGETVRFNDVSFDADGEIVSWDWDFGNGATSTAADPTTSFTTAGTYAVSLTVTDDDGDTDTIVKNVPVDVVPPSAAFDFSITGSEVDFTDASTDDGTIVARSWDFGDGSPPVATANPTHVYATAGTFEVTLIVEDDTGGRDRVTRAVKIDATVAAAFSQSVGYRPSDFERGGRVIDVSSDFSNTAGEIIDGSIFFDSRWQTAAGQDTDQFVIVELAGQGRDVIDSFDVYTRDSAQSVRDYRVEVSVTGTDPSDFTTVLSGTLPRVDGTETMTLPPVRARYLKFVAVNNHGSDSIWVREIGVTTRDRNGGAVGLAGGYPASVVSFSSFAINNLPDGMLDDRPTATPWFTFAGDIDGSFDGVPGAQATFDVGGPLDTASINRIELQSESSSSRPTAFTLLVSETTTDDAAFREVYSGPYDPAQSRISETFPAVDARFVRLRIDSAIGGQVVIHDLDVFNELGVDVLRNDGVGATVIDASSPETSLANRWNRMIDYSTQLSSCPSSFRFGSDTNEDVTILLSEHRPTLIDRVLIHGNGAGSPESVEVLVSTTGTDPGDFTSLGVFDTTAASGPGAVAHFDVVAATYVKVRLIDMVGTSGVFAICSINVFAPEISAPTAVFDNLSTSAAGIDSVLWDFGDGATSTELHPVHTFPGPGTYEVELSVTSGGETSTSRRPIVVFPGPDTGITLTPFDPEGFFEGRSFTYEGAPGANGYEWVFDIPTEVVTRTAPTGTLAPRENGAATATLTAIDQHLQAATASQPFVILNQAPTVNSASDITLPWGVEWEMEGQGFNDQGGGNDPIDCQWDFGNGDTSGVLAGCPDIPRQSGIFIVPRPGFFPYDSPASRNYTTTFTAYDDDGGAGVNTTAVTITKRESLVTLQQVTSDPAGIDVFGSLEDLVDGTDIVGAEVTLSYLGEDVTVRTD
ncbi:MAG: PKD domain-containing protein, partial [Actinomycetota bacterium]